MSVNVSFEDNTSSNSVTEKPSEAEENVIDEIIVTFPGQDTPSPGFVTWQENPYHNNVQQDSAIPYETNLQSNDIAVSQSFDVQSNSQNVDSNASSGQENSLLSHSNYYEEGFQQNDQTKFDYNISQSKELPLENHDYDYNNYYHHGQDSYSNHSYESYGPQETYSTEYNNYQVDNNGDADYQKYSSESFPHYSTTNYSTEVNHASSDIYYPEVGANNSYENYNSAQELQYQQYDQHHQYYSQEQSYATHDYANQTDRSQHHPPSLTQPTTYSDAYYQEYQYPSSSNNDESGYYNNDYDQNNYYSSQYSEYANNSTFSNDLGQQTSNYYENDASAYATPLTHPSNSQNGLFSPAVVPYNASNSSNIGIAMSHNSSADYTQHLEPQERSAVLNDVPPENAITEEAEDDKQGRHLQVWEKFFQNAFAMREAATELDEARNNNSSYQDTFDRVSRTSSSNGYSNSGNAMIHAASSKRVDFRSEKARHYFNLTTPSPSFPHSNSTSTNNIPNYPWPELISNRKYLSLVSFVENNVNVAVRDISLLYFAIVASILQRDEHNLETLLLLAGAHVRHIRDTFHRHLLHYAAYIGDVSIMALLLDTLVTDMDINEFDDYNEGAKSMKKKLPVEESILHVAVKHNHANIVEFLIQSAIDVHRVDGHGWTASQWAQYLGYNECMHFLKEAEAATPVVHVNPELTVGDISPMVSTVQSLPSQTNSSVTFINPSSSDFVGQKRTILPVKQLSETQAMPMTRMIDQFLLSGLPEPTPPVTPAVPTHVSQFDNSTISNNTGNNHHYQDHVQYDNATNKSSEFKNSGKSAPVPGNSSFQSKQQENSTKNSISNNSSENLYKPMLRPKEVDDLIKGLAARDKARRSGTSSNNVSTSGPYSSSVPPPSSSHSADLVRTHSSSPTQGSQGNVVSSKKSTRHARANSSSSKSSHQHLSPGQKHFYDISSDSDNQNQHSNSNNSSNNNSANNRGNRMMESPRLHHSSGNGHNSSPGQQYKVSSRKTSASNPTTNQNHYKNNEEQWSPPKKQLHHSDADDETELHGSKRRLASSKSMQEEEEDMIVEEEVIPSLAERLAVRLWSLLWFMLQLSVSLLFNRPLSKNAMSSTDNEEEDGNEYEDDQSQTRYKAKTVLTSKSFHNAEDDDNDFLYNNSKQKVPKSSLASASPSYIDKTSRFVRSLFHSPISPSTSTEGKNDTPESTSTGNSGKLRLSQPPSNIAADVQQQQRVFLSSAPPPTDLELTRHISSSLPIASTSETSTLPPSSHIHPNQVNSLHRENPFPHYSSTSNSHMTIPTIPNLTSTQSSDANSSNIVTPRQPPPEVQVAIAISRQQQQQQQNSFSLGDKLPQGVAWRYVNILPENSSHTDAGRGNGPSGLEQPPMVGDEHGAQLRQRKPKVYA